MTVMMLEQEQTVPLMMNLKEESTSKSITSTSTFSSVNSSANSSTSTTPHLNLNKGFDKEFDGEFNRDWDIPTETEDTVIHHTNNYTNEVDGTDDYTRIFDGDTKRTNLNIDEFIDRYINNIIESRNQLNNEIYLLFEEFKFDLINDNLLSNSHTSNINISDNTSNIIDDDFESNMFIKLSDTPYLILIHSIRPEILSFSINCYIRKNILSLDKISLLKLSILSVSIINMKNNSKLGLKLYSKMLINRTRKLIKIFRSIENYYLRNTRNKFKKGMKTNLCSSSLHFLISIIVKKIEKLLLNFDIDLLTLWQYLVIYGFDNNNEELKIIRNIIQNPKSCSCMWCNESNRLVKALKYTKKILVCIIISAMDSNNNHYAPDDVTDRSGNEKEVHLFMKRFWNKFGIEKLKFINESDGNPPKLLFETKVLGISTILDNFNMFLDNFRNELIEEQHNNKDGDCSVNDFKLDVLSEHNEDDRIAELNRLTEKIGYKLDLIELGINTKNETNDANVEFLNLRSDINNLVSHYNDITTTCGMGIDNMTSGKSSCKLSSKAKPTLRSKFQSNTSFTSESKSNSTDEIELKRLRMSEILLDEYDVNNKDMTTGHRRSSGISVKLLSVVKDIQPGEERNEGKIIVDTEEGDRNVNEFKRTLEKLCMDKQKLSSQASLEESAFDEFKKELKERLEGEKN